MMLPDPHEGLTTTLSIDYHIEIQPADPEKGWPRIQAYVKPGGVDLFVDTGDTGKIAIFMSTDAWQKLVTMYVQRNPEQFKLPASLVLAEEMLQRHEKPVIPMYLRRTMYKTIDLAYLLSILNTQSERQHDMVRELIDEFLTHGMTPHIVELLQTHTTENAFDRIRITLGGIDHHFELPVFEQTWPAIHRLFTSKDSWRLKHCVECEKYYFDATRSGKQQHCTPRCKSRHTSRSYYARRRAAQASLSS